MPTSLITRNNDGPGVESVKGTPLTTLEVDNNFITLAENKLERSNNLSDVTNPSAARENISAPSQSGAGAFGSWTISVTGNAGTASRLQNARNINGVAFDGSSDITITSATNSNLIFGTGLTSTGNFDGSTERIVEIDTTETVATFGSQSIDGIKTFNSVVALGTQANASDHAVRADRNVSAGSGLIGGGDLTSDITFSVDAGTVVLRTNDQTIGGSKTFTEAVVLDTPGTLVDHAVRADRSVLSGDGLDGGANLTSDVTLSVDDTVIRTTGNQTLGDVKTFTNPPVLTNPSTLSNQAVRSDRIVSAGDGLSGGGDLTSNITLEADSSVVRTFGTQTIDGAKTFSDSVVLIQQATAADEAVRADRDISTGDGLSGGGDLTSDVDISVDNTVVRTFGTQTIDGAKSFTSEVELGSQATGTTSAVRADRAVESGDGLSGGGTLVTDRTLSVDDTVIRTTGNQTLDGTKTFNDAVVLNTQATQTDEAVRADRVISTGGGLIGGGNLTGNLTLSVDASVARTNTVINAGDGLSGGGDISSNRTLSVDNTVVRTSGAQTIDGEKTFSDAIVLGTQAVQTDEAVRADRTVSAGDGLNGGGDLTSDRSLSVDGTVVRITRNVSTGDGLTGGGSLGTDLTLSLDGSVVRTSDNQTIGGTKTFSNPVVLGAQASTSNHAVRADRSISTSNGLLGGGILTNDVSLSLDNSVVTSGVPTSLSSTWALNVGDEGGSLDTDFQVLVEGDILTGNTSGATAVVESVDADEGLTFAAISVRMISSTEFESTGEDLSIEGKPETITISSANENETYSVKDIRGTDEIIDFIPSSSENIENITDIPNALDKVLAIGGKLFDWTDDHLSNKGLTVDPGTGETGNLHIQKSDFGVVAEDVQSVFPEAVRERTNGEVVVDYRKLFALSFAAIVELKEQIDQL